MTLAELALSEVRPDQANPVAWSPNSAQIAFVAQGAAYGVRLLTIGADGSGLRQHARWLDPEAEITSLAFSADGAYLTVQMTAADGQAATTIVTELATGEQRREALVGLAGLAWSPTGHRLAVLTQEGVKVRDLDSGAVRWVTLARCDYVAWYRLPPDA